MPDRQVSTTRNNERSQRNLFVGVGFFVAAVLIIGMILFAGRGNDGDGQQGVVVGQVTNTATSQSNTAQPGTTSTSTRTAEATSPPNTSTSTTGVPAPTATGENAEPTSMAEVEEQSIPTEPEADPTEESEPTEEPVVEEPEPTEEAPFVGEFGTLPPVQIVSGGLSRSLDLEYEMAASLSASPSSALVYLLDWPAWTEDDVATIAANLGLDGEH